MKSTRNTPPTPVARGGDIFDASVRCVAVAGGARVLVIGFAAGRIPKLPVNLALVQPPPATRAIWFVVKKQNTVERRVRQVRCQNRVHRILE